MNLSHRPNKSQNDSAGQLYFHFVPEMETSTDERIPGTNSSISTRVDSLASVKRIQRLLFNLDDIDSLKKLFWSELGFGRVNTTLSPRILPESLRPSIIEILILAEFLDLTVVYLHLGSASFSLDTCSRMMLSLKNQFLQCLLVTSNNVQTDWAFSLARYDEELKLRLRHIRLNSESDTYELARRLAALDFSGIEEEVIEGLTTEIEASIGALDELEDIFEDEILKEDLEGSLRQRTIEEIYQGEISRFPLLTPDEEQDLIGRMEETKADGLVFTTYRNRLIEHNLRLVYPTAEKSQYRGLEMIDLLQEGNLGLMKAADRYDSAKGNRFSTYAVAWIRQSVSRAIANYANCIRLPVYLFEQMRFMWAVKNKLPSELMREPTLEEWANAAELTVEQLERLILIPQHKVSLDDTIDDDRRRTLSDVFPGPNAYETGWFEGIFISDLRNYLETKLNMLKPNQKRVLELRFGLEDGEEKTLEQIGEILGLTRERIRQIENRGLKVLGKLVRFSQSSISFKYFLGEN